MNYRHAYHAGNFADLVKHAGLLRLLALMKAGTQPLTVIDTHAGAGLYDLTSEEAIRGGESLTGKERKIEVTDGELIEVDIEAMRKQQRVEQGSARTLPDLVALGLRRGQNRPAEWAANVMAARQGRKPTPGDYKAAQDSLKILKHVWGMDQKKDDEINSLVANADKSSKIFIPGAGA